MSSPGNPGSRDGARRGRLAPDCAEAELHRLLDRLTERVLGGTATLDDYGALARVQLALRQFADRRADTDDGAG